MTGVARCVTRLPGLRWGSRSAERGELVPDGRAWPGSPVPRCGGSSGAGAARGPRNAICHAPPGAGLRPRRRRSALLAVRVVGALPVVRGRLAARAAPMVRYRRGPPADRHGVDGEALARRRSAQWLAPWVPWGSGRLHRASVHGATRATHSPPRFAVLATMPRCAGSRLPASVPLGLASRVCRSISPPQSCHSSRTSGRRRGHRRRSGPARGRSAASGRRRRRRPRLRRGRRSPGPAAASARGASASGSPYSIGMAPLFSACARLPEVRS